MRRLLAEALRRFGGFFTNWREYDAAFETKIRLTVRNRLRAFATLEGCCGNLGEPGC